MYLNNPRETEGRSANASPWTASTDGNGSGMCDVASVTAAAAVAGQQQRDQGFTKAQRVSSSADRKDEESNVNLENTMREDEAQCARKVTFGEQEPPQQQRAGSSRFLNPIRAKGVSSSAFMPGMGKRYRTRPKPVPGPRQRSDARPGRASSDVDPPHPAAKTAPTRRRNDPRSTGTVNVAPERPRKVAPWKSILLCWGCRGGGVEFSAGNGRTGGRRGEGVDNTRSLPRGTKTRASGPREDALPPPGQLVGRAGSTRRQQATDLGEMDGRAVTHGRSGRWDSGASERTSGAHRALREASLEVSPCAARPNTRLVSSSAPTVEGSASSTGSADGERKRGSGESPDGEGVAAGVDGDVRATSSAAGPSAIDRTALRAARLSNALRGLENRRGSGHGRRRRGGGGGKVSGDEGDDDELETTPNFPPPRFASFPGLSPAASFASTATLAAALAATSPCSSRSSFISGAAATAAASRAQARREADESEGSARNTAGGAETPKEASTAALLWQTANGTFLVGSPDSAAASTFERSRGSPAAASPMARHFGKGSRYTQEGDDARRTGLRVRSMPRRGSTPAALATAVAANKVVVVHRAASRGGTRSRDTNTEGAEDRRTARTARGRRTKISSARSSGGGGGGGGAQRANDQQPQQRGRPLAARVGPRPVREAPRHVASRVPRADPCLPRPDAAEATAATFAPGDSGA